MQFSSYSSQPGGPSLEGPADIYEALQKTLTRTVLNTDHVKKRIYFCPAYRKDTGQTPEGHRKKKDSR